MVDRPRTLAYLLGSEFQDGQSAASISPQDVRDLIVSLFDFYHVRNYGAIADGSSHPASSAYGSLAATQAVYPLATAQTQEIDFLAAQAAIAACAVTGGEVIFDQGTYVMSQTGSTTDTLVIPDVNDGASPQVNLRGRSDRSTILKWNRDLGTGKFAICCGDPTGTAGNNLGRYANTYEGHCSDFTIIGPAADPSYGTVGTNMKGFGWGAKRNMSRIIASQFWAGFSIVGDHALWLSCTGNNCHYGLYFDDPSAVLFGDAVFVKCTFGLAGWAAVGVHPNSGIAHQFDSCFFGTSPYGIFFEATSTPAITGMLGSTFNRCMFEFCGNAVFWDDYATGVNSKIITDTVFSYCNFSQSDTYKTTFGGRSFQSMFHLGIVRGLRIVGVANAFGMIPGSDCLMDTYVHNAIHFEGDIAVVWANCDTAVKPFMSSANTTTYLDNTWLDYGFPTMTGSFEGTDGSTIAAGNVVEMSGSDGNAVSLGSSTSDAFACGVAVMAKRTVGGAPAAFIPVQKTGVAVVVYTGALDTAKPFVKAASGQVASSATGLADAKAMGQWRWTNDATHVQMICAFRC